MIKIYGKGVQTVCTPFSKADRSGWEQNGNDIEKAGTLWYYDNGKVKARAGVEKH